MRTKRGIATLDVVVLIIIGLLTIFIVVFFIRDTGGKAKDKTDDLIGTTGDNADCIARLARGENVDCSKGEDQMRSPPAAPTGT